MKGKSSTDLNETSYQPGLKSAPLHSLLPKIIGGRLRKGFAAFGQKMHGYYTNEANIIGVESRTSSPVNIPRKENLEHPQIEGLCSHVVKVVVMQVVLFLLPWMESVALKLQLLIYNIKMMTSEQIIKKLDLQEHPEGGYFKEMYRSSESISEANLGSNFNGSRNYSTAIYFLLTSEKFSAFHRIQQDEIWHFYKGSPLKLHMISKKGKYSFVMIGNDLEKEEQSQFVVPAGDWFAAEVIGKNGYSLTGCTVAPGFDFKDFELPSKNELTTLFPNHAAIIEQLTHH